MRDAKVSELSAGDAIVYPQNGLARVVADVERLPYPAGGTFADEDQTAYGVLFTDGAYEELSGGEYVTVE